MDRIFSARIDDAAIQAIEALSHKLHSSKKAIIEKAVFLLSEKNQQENGFDVFDDTCGAWKRDEKPGETVAHARDAFEKSMKRLVR